MLTFSSDSLPQIVCPMDEDVIPSNPFCSAPPHTEPPPPLLSLSSITPSCANDGISGNRRSGRIQSIRAQTPKKHDDTIDIRETPKPSRQNPSPTRRHRESGNMVQVTQSKQPRVEVNHEQEKHNEDEFDFNFAAYRCQSKQIDQKTSDVSSSAAADVVEPENDGDDAEILDGVKSDMDADASVENSSASKGWVIGPLFQSFKSKMASFTEIVMSPVKLFRANSPPLSMDQTEKLTVTDETSDVFQTVGDEKQEVEVDLQRINEVEEAENTKPSAFKYCKRISFDTEMSTPSCEPADECATQKEKNSPDPVPFLDDSLTCVVSKQISESIESVISSSCVGLSASQSERAVRVKAPPRKRTGNRSELKRSVSKPLTSELRQKESEICQTNSVQLDSKQTDLFSSSVCFTPPDGAGDGLVRQSIWNNVNNCVNRKTVDAQHLENQFNSDAPAVGLVRPKRGLKVSCQTQEVAKRKKVTATGDLSTDETKNPESLIITSLRGKTRKELTTTKTIEEKEETVKPLRKRQTGSTRANRKGKVGQEMFPTINESVLNSSPDPMLVCSLDQNNVVSENKQKNCSGSKTKQTASNKRLKTKPDLRKPDVNMDSMDLETTLAITSTKRDEEEPLNDVLIRPSNNKNVNKKPLKRKSPTMNSESTLVSTSSVLLTQPGEFNSSTSAQGEENLKPGLNQTSKKSRKGSRAAVKSHESDAQDTDLHPTKENKQTDPVYFEMTPFESKHQPVPAPSQPHLECYVQLNNEVKQLIDNKMTMSAPETDDVFPPDANDNNQSSVTASKLRSRRVGAKARRADKQRRRCRVLHQATHEGEEVTNSVTMEDADLSASGCRSSENKISRRLLRSYSCPEIPSLRLHDAPWTPPFHSPHHNRTHLSHQHHSSHAPLVPHVHKSPRRARRHTVCSVEVEREIAPLCLRKEIYPTRRSAPHDGVAHFSPGVALSPSASLTALASCFLSSPLAFLSKKVDIRGAASSPSASNHVSSSSPLTCPSSSSSWQLPGFLQRNDSSRGTSDSSSSVNPLVCEIERRRQREEEDDGEDTSSSSQEFEDVALREEKALSDSEIKVVQKHEERGKVSSIRIRKTLPKPQNNLTPMGLPKPIRLKKKEFSLEEIYTNKNFSKPPESRLETIFEVPLNRRNGSESWFGQRRVKRFLEFLEVGEVRKPKKPLVGVGKASINSSSRTRRGSFTKDEALLNVQDVDSLLCAKLDQLNLWLIHDQTES